MNLHVTQRLGHKDAGHATRPETRAAVWAFMKTYMRASQGRPPTAREIRAGAGLSSLSTVHRALADLEYDGLIRRGDFGTTRGIRIIGATYRLPDEAGEKPGGNE